jgi:hypothetical protein
MTLKRWRMLVATKVILAAGVAGEADAQQGGIVQPPASPIIVQTPAGASCAPRRTPSFPIWNHCKGRLEHWFAHDQPDAVPLGQSVYQSMTTQVDNGVAVRMILNDFDFEPNSANLNQRGREKLPHLAGLAFRYPYVIVVERPNYDPGLAKRRVDMTRKELARMAIPLQPERIVEGGTLTRGLDGVEALILYDNLLNQTQSQRSSSGQGQSGAGFGSRLGILTVGSPGIYAGTSR